MKAAVYTEYGPPDVLQVQEIEKPIPADDEILIRVHATTVTAGDARMRAFRVPRSFWLPGRLALGVFGPRRQVLGMELAGEIEAIGQNVTRFKVGDPVFASAGFEKGTRAGGYAEYCCLPEDGLIARKPERLSHSEAASLCVGGHTALYFLREAEVKPGDEVLIYGASGSVGTFAVQLAKHFGARVTAVCSSTNRELVESLGADRVIDYTKEDFSDNQETYDVVFDAVGLADYAACMRALKKDGTFMHAVATPAVYVRMFWTRLTTGRKAIGGGPPSDPADLVLLGELAAAGTLRVIIDKTYPLAEIAEAHRYVDTGRKRGNVVVLPPKPIALEAAAAPPTA